MNYIPDNPQTKDPCHQLVLEAVLGLPQMQDKRLIHLSIVGSRSKGLASSDSDYDVKATILHPVSDHLLQKVTKSKSFCTHIVHPETGQEVEVEGTLVNYLTMQQYALATNPTAYDALFGLTVFETPESAALQDLFCKSYDPSRLAVSYEGLLHHERKQAVKQNRHGHIKHAANMVYYASMVQGLCCCREGEPLPHDAFVVLERLQDLSPELKEQICKLYEQRREDKSRTDVDTTPFEGFINAASQMEIPKPRQRNAEVTKELEEEAEAVFLGMMYATMRNGSSR